MEVHFTPEQEARLAQIATNAGTDAEQLVRNAALRLLEEADGVAPLPAGSVLAEMRALRARVKPDPEGGPRVITFNTAAVKWLWSSMLRLPSRGACPTRAANMPMPF